MEPRLRRSVLLVLAAAGAGLVLVGLAAAVGWARDIPLEDVAGDPNEVFDADLAIGLLTRVSVLVWAAAAGIAIAAGLLGRRWSAPEAAVLLAFGGVAAVLVTDEALLFHEAAGRAGIPRGLVLGVYGAAVLLLLWRLRVPLRSTPWIVLIAACGWLALSAGIDVLLDNFLTSSALNFTEDGLKMLGILTWSLYLVLVARALALSLPNRIASGHETGPGLRE
jgi:hypothetical protein